MTVIIKNMMIKETPLSEFAWPAGHPEGCICNLKLEINLKYFNLK